MKTAQEIEQLINDPLVDIYAVNEIADGSGDYLIQSNIIDMDELAKALPWPTYRIKHAGFLDGGMWRVRQTTKADLEEAIADEEQDIIQLQESIQEMLASIEHRKQEIEMLKALVNDTV